MKNFGRLEFLYLVNSVLLFAHEEDSAYWNEWILFGLPGGIQVFLIMDLVLISVGLIGFRCVILKRRSGLWFSLIQAGCGILAFLLHGVFILKGHPEFTLPMSELLLVLILVISAAQAIVALDGLRQQPAPAA